MNPTAEVRIKADVGIQELAHPEKFNCLTTAARGAVAATQCKRGVKALPEDDLSEGLAAFQSRRTPTLKGH